MRRRESSEEREARKKLWVKRLTYLSDKVQALL